MQQATSPYLNGWSWTNHDLLSTGSIATKFNHFFFQNTITFIQGNSLKNIVSKMITISLTHWAQVTNISDGKLTIIGSDNGLSPDQRQAIIWTNAGILSIGPLGTNSSEILITIQTFSFKKMHLNMSSGVSSQPQCVKKKCLVEERDYKSILSDGLEQCIILSRNAHNQNKHIISQKWHYQINSAIWCLYWINSEINYKWLPTNGLNTPSPMAESQRNCLIGTWYQLLNSFNLLVWPLGDLNHILVKQSSFIFK